MIRCLFILILNLCSQPILSYQNKYEVENNSNRKFKPIKKYNKNSTSIPTYDSISLKKTLQQIMQDLEKSESGSYGGWENFSSRKIWPKSKPLQASSNNPSSPLVEQNMSVGQSNAQRPDIFDSKPLLSSEIKPYIGFDSSQLLNLKSFFKIFSVIIFSCVLSYLSVVPRTVSLADYNVVYKENLVRLLSSYVFPFLLLGFLYRAHDANINTVVDGFFGSFFIGYPSLCLLEFALATGLRLIVFKLLEPEMFRLCPRVPALTLPWVFASHGFFPSRLSLLLISLTTSCVLAPVIEEAFKGFIFRRLLRDLHHGRQPNSPSNKAALQARDLGAQTSFSPSSSRLSVRSYVIHMTAIALGIKVADSTRRILLYTAPHHKHKDFFAVARSFFPVHELCAIMTALHFARRDLHLRPFSANSTAVPAPVSPTGRTSDSAAKAAQADRGTMDGTFDVKSYSAVSAMILHSMACFRGMKPLFVWDSSRPWDELQLQAWGATSNATPQQLLLTAFLNFLWFTVLLRHLNQLLKIYFSLALAETDTSTRS